MITEYSKNRDVLLVAEMLRDPQRTWTAMKSNWAPRTYMHRFGLGRGGSPVEPVLLLESGRAIGVSLEGEGPTLRISKISMKSGDSESSLDLNDKKLVGWNPLYVEAYGLNGDWHAIVLYDSFSGDNQSITDAEMGYPATETYEGTTVRLVLVDEAAFERNEKLRKQLDAEEWERGAPARAEAKRLEEEKRRQAEERERQRLHELDQQALRAGALLKERFLQMGSDVQIRWLPGEISISDGRDDASVLRIKPKNRDDLEVIVGEQKLERT